MKCYGIY